MMTARHVTTAKAKKPLEVPFPGMPQCDVAKFTKAFQSTNSKAAVGERVAARINAIDDSEIDTVRKASDSDMADFLETALDTLKFRSNEVLRAIARLIPTERPATASAKGNAMPKAQKASRSPIRRGLTTAKSKD